MRHSHPMPLTVSTDAVSPQFIGFAWAPFSGLPKVLFADPTPSDNGSAMPTDWSVGSGDESRFSKLVGYVMHIKAWSAPVNQGSINIAALTAQVTELNNTLANLFKTPTDVTTSRAINEPYTNNTGRPIFVSVVLPLRQSIRQPG